MNANRKNLSHGYLDKRVDALEKETESKEDEVDLSCYTLEELLELESILKFRDSGGDKEEVDRLFEEFLKRHDARKE